VGIVGLQEARNDAKRRLAEYTLGKTKPQAVSWDAAREEYLGEKIAKLKPRTHADYTYELNRHFKYGPTKLCDLSPRDLWKNLDRLSKTPAEQQHAFVTLRAFMRWAHRKHYTDRNPMERMQAPHRYIARDRILTNEELKKVWHVAGDDAFGRLVKLLILTGQRVGEIRQLMPEMIGEDTITLPSWLAKNSREHVIPLSATAKSILPLENAGQYLLPARGTEGRKPFNGFSTAKPKLDKRCGVSGWVLHDLRRTFASGLASIGVTIPVIERLLNHVSGSFSGIVGVYQRYDFFPEMRDAISRWEDHVQKLTQD
jgi:integrase